MKEAINGWGLSSFRLEPEEQYRVHDELIKWKDQNGLVIGMMPKLDIPGKAQTEYLIVKWDDGHMTGISPKMATKI